jgi:hypothetical protein
MTIPASAASYLIISDPWLAVMASIFLAVAAITAALLLLPAVWSRKKSRRDAAYGLAELIIGWRRT